ncbi:MAG: hypothetical protein JJU11_18410, partial [Candidatus Sumerlaeia bacterium]|nr:hypothetical protein [Candidatus Sumerlaeia bacterium]
TVTIAALPAVTNATDHPGIAITFSEPVTGLELSDFSTDGISLSNLAGSGADYTVDVTLIGEDGEKSFSLAAGAASDTAGNESLASNVVTTILDTTPPSVVIAGLPDLTNQTSHPGITITFSESVSGLGLDDFDTNGVNLSNLQGSGTDYTVDVLLTGEDGLKSLSLNAGAAADAAGNASLASNTISTTLDTTQPGVTIAALPNPTRETVHTGLAINFSEDVTGLELSDFVTDGMALTNLLGSGTSYTIDVELTGEDGVKSLSLPADAATDSAGNLSLASNIVTTTLDTTPPTVTIASLPATTSQTSFTEVAITFSETVTGFGLDDFATNEMVVSNLQGGGTSYTVDVTITGEDGEKSFSVNAGAAVDAAGNASLASNLVTVTLNTAAPSVTIAGLPSITNQTSFPGVTVTFSEAVSGLEVSDFVVDGVEVSNLQGSDANYTIDVTLTGEDGSKSIFLPAGAAENGLGNLTGDSNTLTTTLDRVAPTVTIAAIPSVTNQTDLGTVAITFSKSVTGLELSDFMTEGVLLSNLAGSGSSYTIDVELIGEDGTKSFSIPASAASDAAGNASLASNTVTSILDTTRPTVVIADLPAITNETTLTDIAINFSEDVTGLDLGGFSTSGVSLSNLQGGGASYTVDALFTGGEGEKSFSLLAGAATDAAGNESLASNVVSTILDATPPTVAIVDLPEFTNETNFPAIAVTFSKSVTGLELSDFATDGVELSNLQGTDASYTVDVELTGEDGTKSFSLAAGAATDAAGNVNTASNTVSTTLDRLAPSVIIADLPEITNQMDLGAIAVTFSKPVSGLELADFNTDGIALSNLTGTGTAYTVNVELTGEDGEKSFSLAAGAATDVAGNVNTASNTVSTTLDREAPSVVIADLPELTNQTDLGAIAVTFSKPVSGLELADFNTNGILLSNLTGSDASYTVDVELTGEDGTKSFFLAAGAASDSAGNVNAASNTVATVLDREQPTVTIAELPEFTNETTFPAIVVTFSKAVSGLELSDFATDGVELSNLTGSDASYTVDVELTGEDGTKSFSLAAGSATDAAGNINTASNTVSTTLDRVAPSVTIADLPMITNQTDLGAIAVTFSKPVSGLELSDFTTDGIALSNLTGTGTAYTVNVELTGEDGEKSFSLAAGAATDVAGNVNTA